jgi:hydrogenase nickel incorporation protein HypB
VLFRAADLVLITKSDLAPYLEDFDAARAERCLRNLASVAPMHSLSARKREGLEPWLDWLRGELAQVRAHEREARTPSHGKAHRHDHRKTMAR